MSTFDDFLAVEIGQDGRDGREKSSKPTLPPYRAIPPTRLNRKVASVTSAASDGADPQNADESSLINHLAENLPGGDDYARLEREAIQWESQQPPEPPAPEVPGFDGLSNLTATQHGVILHRLMNPAQEPPETAKSYVVDTTQPASVQPAPAMPPQSALCNSGPMVPILEKDRHGETVVRGFRLATQQPARPSAPAVITCGSCSEFEPGLQPQGLGRCSRTANGLPPVASRGYGACFPMAPRTCPDFKEILQ